MTDGMEVYFQGEKTGSLLFIAIGILAIIAASFLFRKGNFQRGVSIPLIAIGIIQIAIGSTVYFRTDRQVSELKRVLQEDPHVLKAKELIRMRQINRNFDVVKTIEIILLIAGLIIALVFRVKNPLISGIGAGLFLQSIISLMMDLYAEKRADLYTSYLFNL